MLRPSPKMILRGAVTFCLIGWGVCLIYQVSHVGPGFERMGLAHDLAIFFFFGIAAFALFYCEYRIAQWLAKRELNVMFGYVQALGCVAILVFGILATCLSHWTHAFGGTADTALLFMLVFGHVVFLGNVIWSYVQENRFS